MIPCDVKVTDNVLHQHCVLPVNFTETRTTHNTARVQLGAVSLASVDYGLLSWAVMPEIVDSAFLRKSRSVVIPNSLYPTLPTITTFFSLSVNPLKKEKSRSLILSVCSTFDKVFAKVLSLSKAQSAPLHFYPPEVTHQATNQADFFCYFPLFTDTDLLRLLPALDSDGPSDEVSNQRSPLSKAVRT